MGTLNKSGLRADRDLGSIYESKFMDIMAQELKSNSLDAICISPFAWKALNTSSPGAFRILAETPQIPGFSLSIRDDLSSQEKTKLATVLAGMRKSPEGKAAWLPGCDQRLSQWRNGYPGKQTAFIKQPRFGLFLN